MAKISFRVKNADSQQYLIHELADKVVIDEDVLTMLEDSEIKGMIPVGVIESATGDSFCYDITDKNTLGQYFEFTVNKNTILTILRNLIYTLIELREHAIPLSYLVLHKGYIYVDIDTLELEFICIPVESEENVSIDIGGFFRTILAGLKYEEEENGDYVAKLLTFVNNKERFSARGLAVILETLYMEAGGPELGEDGEIFGDYTELESYEDDTHKAQILDQTEMLRQAREHMGRDSVGFNSNEAVEATEPEKEYGNSENFFEFVENSSPIPIINIDTNADEPRHSTISESVFKMNNGIKINRAQVIQNATPEEEALLRGQGDTVSVDHEKDVSVELIEDEDEVVSNSILSQVVSQTFGNANSTISNLNTNGPKPMPYLIRVNTNERIMISKQTFKMGKATLGMDYRITDNSAISRNHATIYAKEGVYFIKDNKSTNHTYVNGIIVDDTMDQMLTHDADIILGDEDFIFKLR